MRFAIAFTGLTLSACGASAGAPGDCDGPNPPAACGQACEPPPAADTCPAGFHCGPDGQCTDNGGAGADASLTPDADCPSVEFTTERTIPTVQLLIDQSGSMDQDLAPGVSRWEAVKTALVDEVDGVVTQLQGSVVFGASLYTSYGGGAVPAECPVLVSTADRALGNYADIDALFAANNPAQDTPTGESIDAAVADFLAHPPAAGSPAIIVLATDGEPDSCADPNALARELSVNAAANAYASGIRVIVLSVGDAVAEEHLQQVANAGAGLDPINGDAPYYVATSPAQLETQFQEIIGGVVTCDLTLDGAIDVGQAAAGTVTLDGAPLTFGTDWEATGPMTIRIIGAACDALTAATDPVVTANFPCGAVID